VGSRWSSISRRSRFLDTDKPRVLPKPYKHTHTQPAVRFFDMPLRFPIADKYKDMGTCVMGKLEAGTIKKGESLVLLPNTINVTVEKIFIDQGEGTVSLGEAAPGDNVKMKIKRVEEVCPVDVCQLCVSYEPIWCTVQALLPVQS
jgi:peptide chain release factor subunit 3